MLIEFCGNCGDRSRDLSGNMPLLQESIRQALCKTTDNYHTDLMTAAWFTSPAQ